MSLDLLKSAAKGKEIRRCEEISSGSGSSLPGCCPGPTACLWCKELSTVINMLAFEVVCCLVLRSYGRGGGQVQWGEPRV